MTKLLKGVDGGISGLVGKWDNLQVCYHNIIKECMFVHVGLEDIPMGCLNLVQMQTRYESPYTGWGIPWLY